MTSHDAASRIDDGSAEADLRLGWVLLDLGRNLEAGAAFKRAVQREPSAAAAHEGLGLVLANEERHPAAEVEYREAARLAPGSALTWCRLGESLYAQGRYLEAEISFLDAIRCDAGLATAYAWLGWALFQLRENAEAERAFRYGIFLDPGSVAGHTGLGSVLCDVQQYAEAEAEFREAIRIDPSDAAARRGLGRLMSSMSRHAEAQAAFRAAIGLDPGDADAQRELGDMARAAAHAQVRTAGHDQAAARRRRRTPPAVLLRSPRARPLRRFIAGFTDNIVMVLALISSLETGDYRGLAMATAIYACNGYLEGKTGQSVGKMLTGLHTIDKKTGKFIGGPKGVLRRLLHIADFCTVAGFIIGLFAGQTYADFFMGTIVVWRPTWVKTKSKRGMAAFGTPELRPASACSARSARRYGARVHEVLQLIEERVRSGSVPGRRTDPHRIVLSIEGGGMRGTVSAGMALALHELGVVSALDAVYGASAGALTGAWLVSSEPERLRGWADPDYAKTLIRWSSLLRGRPVVDVRALVEEVYQTEFPMDFASILASPIEYHPLGTDAETGESTDLRPLISSPVALRLALRASASLPFLAGPPVALGDRRFYDAGVAESIPFRTPLAQGATHVLLLRSRRPLTPEQVDPRADELDELTDSLARDANGGQAPPRVPRSSRILARTALRRESLALRTALLTRPVRTAADVARIKLHEAEGKALMVYPPPSVPPVSRLTTDAKLLAAGLESGRQAARDIFGR
jgi:predicted patatin/cPLA2 family phospholipase/Tfp pilus assembly protein PilF